MPPKPLPIVDDPARSTQAPRVIERRRERADSISLAGAQRMLDAGHVDEAKEILAPLAEDPTSPIRAHACLLCAGVQLMSGAAAAALETLAKLPAAPAFPVDEGYRRMIEACALRQLRRYPEALARALEAVEVGPTTARLLVLADAQKHAGRVDDGIRTLTTLLERDPDNATALAQRAGYKNLLDDKDGGARDFARFNEVCADDADAERNRAFYFATRGELDATVSALAAALDAEPDATRAYIADEIELDRFRASTAFTALLG